MPSIMIDTNIILYANDDRFPESQARAQQVLRALHVSNQGCMSVQSLSEFANVCFKKSKFSIPYEQMTEQILLLSRLYRVHELNPLIVLEATRGVREFSLSYFDAQLWACAKLNQIPVVFSEDFQDGQTLEGVRFVNPFAENFELEKWI
ncbi:MAG: PIN domain nuclease [Anaerolineales bacterium]